LGSGQIWDLVVTMDDATNEHYSMFFVEEEGTASSLQGIREVIGKKGLPSSLYTDRGSHYWVTPEAGGKVDKKNLTQFGRAMKQLGIEMIAAYSPEARGRSERAFRTHQERLPKEARPGGNHDDGSGQPLSVQGLSSGLQYRIFPSGPGGRIGLRSLDRRLLDEILCEHHERIVGNDNCVSFEGRILQIPSDRYRLHYVRTTVRIHRHPDGSLSLFHGPRKLSDYPFEKPELPKTKRNHEPKLLRLESARSKLMSENGETLSFSIQKTGQLYLLLKLPVLIIDTAGKGRCGCPIIVEKSDRARSCIIIR